MSFGGQAHTAALDAWHDHQEWWQATVAAAAAAADAPSKGKHTTPL